MRAYGGRNVGAEADQGPSSTAVVDKTAAPSLTGFWANRRLSVLYRSVKYVWPVVRPERTPIRREVSRHTRRPDNLQPAENGSPAEVQTSGWRRVGFRRDVWHATARRSPPRPKKIRRTRSTIQGS